MNCSHKYSSLFSFLSWWAAPLLQKWGTDTILSCSNHRYQRLWLKVLLLIPQEKADKDMQTSIELDKHVFMWFSRNNGFKKSSLAVSNVNKRLAVFESVDLWTVCEEDETEKCSTGKSTIQRQQPWLIDGLSKCLPELCKTSTSYRSLSSQTFMSHYVEFASSRAMKNATRYHQSSFSLNINTCWYVKAMHDRQKHNSQTSLDISPASHSSYNPPQVIETAMSTCNIRSSPILESSISHHLPIITSSPLPQVSLAQTSAWDIVHPLPLLKLYNPLILFLSHHSERPTVPKCQPRIHPNENVQPPHQPVTNVPNHPTNV